MEKTKKYVAILITTALSLVLCGTGCARVVTLKERCFVQGIGCEQTKMGYRVVLYTETGVEEGADALPGKALRQARERLEEPDFGRLQWLLFCPGLNATALLQLTEAVQSGPNPAAYTQAVCTETLPNDQDAWQSWAENAETWATQNRLALSPEKLVAALPYAAAGMDKNGETMFYLCDEENTLLLRGTDAQTAALATGVLCAAALPGSDGIRKWKRMGLFYGLPGKQAGACLWLYGKKAGENTGENATTDLWQAEASLTESLRRAQAQATEQGMSLWDERVNGGEISVRAMVLP